MGQVDHVKAYHIDNGLNHHNVDHHDINIEKDDHAFDETTKVEISIVN